jgi:hypothetical protein
MFRVRYVMHDLSLALGRVAAFSVRGVEVYFQGLLMMYSAGGGTQKNRPRQVPEAVLKVCSVDTQAMG